MSTLPIQSHEQISRNIILQSRAGKRRTSLRLEQELWLGLQFVQDRERISRNQLCSLIASQISARDISLTSAIRVFVLAYHRNLLTALRSNVGTVGPILRQTLRAIDPDLHAVAEPTAKAS